MTYRLTFLETILVIAVSPERLVRLQHTSVLGLGNLTKSAIYGKISNTTFQMCGVQIPHKKLKVFRKIWVDADNASVLV